ncbi:hypothetical protein A6302_04551 [Methylobrevis pamukkalensis]|uniref:Uncharacterized protein n=1 Tax=Methylobrevis pamukkalensis TaxID=1439726 RepID=A0A1E3GMU8_9HYPH|nr:hypothetical protein A6302_04551 [Methylobrevis pamukkalensis]
MAAFSSFARSPSISTAQIELRRSPPMPASVVAEASSSCSAAQRAMKPACHSLLAPCDTRLDILIWCMAKIMPDAEQA